MTKISIPYRWNVAPCFVAEVADDDPMPMRSAVLMAISSNTDLSGADLSRADLSRADLRDADLSGADLSRADLRDTNLNDASLSGADLSGADLSRADLRDADLRDADLSGASLRGANFCRASLRGANLRDADLRGAYLSGTRFISIDVNVDMSRERNDLFLVLNAAPNEVAGLLATIREGRINGSQYKGECACLKGTIANIRHCKYNELGAGPMTPNSSSPSERLFMQIYPGHVPAINPVAKLVEEWIVEWMESYK